MDTNQKHWNENQKVLRENMSKAANFSDMKQLLLSHHAMVHSASVTDTKLWSYEDEIWQTVAEVQARQIPSGQEHSLIWIMWHIARIEDMTMNMLVIDCPQVFHKDQWQKRMNAPIQDTGNEISDETMTRLNESIDVDALKAYRIAVGQQTQHIIRDLQPEDVQRKVQPERIQKLRESGDVVPAAKGIIEYWSKRTVAGLLLMPATRHNFIHLNEAARIKQRLADSNRGESKR